VIWLSRPHPQARYLVPEVVQTSMMDCGPAALQALVSGFGMAVNYGRLREACQTSVDGTSITTMDEIANFLGLDTEEMMVPADHLLLPDAHALPAIVVVKTANGNNHFVVVWSTFGPWVQVMDPAEGRHWILRSALLDRVYLHHVNVPASAWRSWVGEREFLSTLDARLSALAVARADRERLCAAVLADPGWEAMAALDAAARMTASMVASGAVSPGPLCLTLIRQQVERHGDGSYPLIADEYRSVWRAREQAGEEETLRLRGVVLVRARGCRDAARVAPSAIAGDGDEATEATETTGEATAAARGAAAALPAELAAALTEEPARPWRTLLGMLVADGITTPAVLAMVLVVSAALVTANAILLRGILEVGQQLGLASQRAAAMGALIGFLALGLCVELPLVAGALRLGRALDLRLRMAFLAKIPRLDDRYFRSRLLSDMAERGHNLHQVRALPLLGVRLLAAASQLVLTVAGIAWLDPASSPLALFATAICIGVPLVCQPLLAERDLRMRSHAGALGRFYLDALLGLLPIRVHGARPAMQHQQEALLVQWERAGLRFYAASTLVDGALAICGLGMAVLIVWSVSSHPTSGLLLLVYWALSLPALGQDIAIVARQYPMVRNVVLRLLEPLGTPEPIERVPAEVSTPPTPPTPPPAIPAGDDRAGQARGVAIRMSGVSVEAAGNTVLDGVELAVSPGEHVAIVGPSGAGKSSLVGLLLGWYRPARGTVVVDGRPLVGDWLSTLRSETAWVDPEVMLWNRSFLENLRYGAEHDGALPLAEILSKAQLREVLEHLPDGLATELGEGGALVSGGEGQRTRVGRALARKRARLVILDEPFRGLDLTTRRALLTMARQWWCEATLLWVTHDIAETAQLGRVLVIDAGRIVEDGDPAELGSRAGSRYAALVRGDRDMHELEWSGAKWRRVWIERGKLREEGGDA
jgi:ABC-type bacteriocin/lantibiotic exporter with double-glycine peptidase domain